MCGPHRRMPQVLSTITTMDYVQYSVKILVGLNTISGKYCYNCKGGRPRHETSRRGSIPQAVSTVANKMLEGKEPEDFWIISILQAIGTFTLFFSFSPPFGQGLEMCGPHRRFSAISHPSSHIASGKYCCNMRKGGI